VVIDECVVFCVSDGPNEKLVSRVLFMGLGLKRLSDNSKFQEKET